MKVKIAHVCIALLFPLFVSCGTIMHSYARNDGYNAIVQVQSPGKQILVTPHANDRSVDLWRILKDYPGLEIVLDGDIVVVDAPANDMTIPTFKVDGKGHTIIVGKFPIMRTTEVKLNNVVFDCGKATDRIIYTIDADKNKEFVVRNCVFRNPTEKVSLCPRGFGNVLIENCTFEGSLTSNSIRKEKSTAQVLLYECHGSVIVKNNNIHHCFGTAIEGIGFSADKDTRVLVENNQIDMVSNGGIVFAGGEVWNATVRNNTISNTHCLGQQFEGEVDGGPNSAVNFHGFRNVVVEDNIIKNSPKSVCFDFDGSIAGGKKIEKGTGLIIRRNVCDDAGAVALFVVKDVVFRDNVLSNPRNNQSSRYMWIYGASNVEVSNNHFSLTSGSAKSFYPISVSDSRDVVSGSIKVGGNKVETDGKIFVFVNKKFEGECQIDDNEIISPYPTASVVNNSKAKVSIPQSKKIVWYK